ncbi:MAG: aminotransferase class III-fold pyridoxal phosphate-dependent enzyme [Clostridia bacterium]|nr:aminotransferase class III-fold pyridoxal phosphate-dependent enzyme [Clostridia bacterium]
MHNINEYNKSREAFMRACRVIPSGIYGHQGPAEGCYVPIEAFPLYSQKAEGTYLWDLDGNKFIDYMCAYGPNILGYHDPDVDAAAAKQRAISDCTTLPNTKMIDFAELLVETVACADWAFFAKNGNDVTTLAIMAARAHTHRKKIVFFKGYYHGVSPWTQKIDYAGVIEEDVMHNIYVEWNNFTQLEEVFEKYKGEIAAVIGQPYMHGNFMDNILPAEGFWQFVRKKCTEEGTVLVVDDVRAGFRLDLAGSDHYFGFEADMICFCKALANGYNVSALCGKEFMKNAISSMSYTGSYWMSAVPFAAGIACIEKMKKLDLPKILIEKGTKLKNGLEEAAKEFSFDLHVTGVPSLFYLRIADDPSLKLHQEWIAECVKRGVFFTNHHNHFINYALSDEDIAETVEIAREAFSVVRDRHPL